MITTNNTSADLSFCLFVTATKDKPSRANQILVRHRSSHGSALCISFAHLFYEWSSTSFITCLFSNVRAGSRAFCYLLSVTNAVWSEKVFVFVVFFLWYCIVFEKVSAVFQGFRKVCKFILYFYANRIVFIKKNSFKCQC